MSWDTFREEMAKATRIRQPAPPLHGCSIARKDSRASEPVNTSRI